MIQAIQLCEQRSFYIIPNVFDILSNTRMNRIMASIFVSLCVHLKLSISEKNEEIERNMERIKQREIH